MRPHAALLIPLAVLCTVHAHAQDESIDPNPGNEEQVDRARSVLPRVGTDQTPVQPSRTPESKPHQPGLTGGQDWLQILSDTLETEIGASTLAEGSFVLARLGDLIQTEAGLVIFVPDRGQREPGEGAVLLMPCRTLEQLQSEWSGQRVLVSGEIFTYHGRNQLLISDYRLVQPTSRDNEQGTEPQREQDPGEAQPLEDDPQVQDLLRELDRDTPATRETQPDPLLDQPETLPRRPVQAPEPASSGFDEGELLLRRPARLVRNANGAWTIVFDNDNPEGDDTAPLIVLPCRALMKIENWAMQQGDAARMIVSGRVYTYQGDPYLLPTLAQRAVPSDINSIQ